MNILSLQGCLLLAKQGKVLLLSDHSTLFFLFLKPHSICNKKGVLERELHENKNNKSSDTNFFYNFGHNYRGDIL